MEQSDMFGIVHRGKYYSQGEYKQIKQKEEEDWQEFLKGRNIESNITAERYEELRTWLIILLKETAAKSKSKIEQLENKSYSPTEKQIKLKVGSIGLKELNERRRDKKIEYLQSIIQYCGKSMAYLIPTKDYKNQARVLPTLETIYSTFKDGVSDKNIDQFENLLVSGLKKLK